VGKRLAVPAGTSVRFEPGISMTVELVDYAGAGITAGFRGLYSGGAS
jgi:urease subunit beta